ncbi:hypothetical protein Bbelb_368820 [Branchiostoma belcheri]|nr:hypothetical protein Bbelb_368820 [Branchiostoma belcheri]
MSIPLPSDHSCDRLSGGEGHAKLVGSGAVPAWTKECCHFSLPYSEGMGKGTEKGRRLMALSLGYLSVKAGNWQYSAAEETHLGRCMQDEQPQTVQKNGHFWSEELCLEQEKDMQYKVLPAKDFLVLLKTHHYRLPVPTSSGNKESRLLGLTPPIAGEGDLP